MPPPQDNARFIFLVMMILWLNTSNDATAGILSAPSIIMGRVGRQRAAFEAVQPTKWGDFHPGASNTTTGEESSNTTDIVGAGYLNITGFRREDNLAWDDLGRFRARCLEWSRNAFPLTKDGTSFWDRGETMLTWQNATGSVAGEWVRRPASVERQAASYNMTAIHALSFDWGGASNSDIGGRGGGFFGSGPRRPVDRTAAVLTNGTGTPLFDKYLNASGIAAATNLRRDTANTEKKDDKVDFQPMHPRHFPLQAVEWGRNITGGNGRMVVRVTDEDDEAEFVDEAGRFEDEPPTGGLVRTATAHVTLEDVEGTGSSYDMRMHGVHWPRQGVLLLTTTSDKFGGIFGLPHLAPGRSYFDSSKHLLNRTIEAALAKREAARLFGPPDPTLSAPLWTSNADGAPEGLTPLPRCEYVMYVQIHPLDASQFLAKAGSQVPLGKRDTADVNANSSVPLQSHESLVSPRNLDYDYSYSQDDMTRIMNGIEHEMRFPTGAPIFGRRGVPELQMSAVLYSPDCAYFVETKGPPLFAAAPEGDGGILPSEQQPLLHLRGKKVETVIYDTRLWMLALAAVLFGQVKLFVVQVRETYTPSTLGRISFSTIAAMVMGDGMVFCAASAWTMTASASLLPSLVVTFAAWTAMVIGGYFLSEIYAAQEPERRRRDRQEMQQIQQRQQEIRERLREHYERLARMRAAANVANAANAASNTTTAATTSTLPAPAPARPASPPIIIPSDQDVDAEIAENARAAATPILPVPAAAPAATATANTTATTTNNNTIALPPSVPFSNVAGRMVMITLITMFLSLAASTWWASWRSIYANLVCFIYLSMWLPQIVRNIERNSRRAFAWRFIVGQSVLRLLPIAYFYLKADNFLFAQTDWRSFGFLTGWVWLQIWVLVAQHELGPRFGIPSGWVPEAWEYHPVLREDNVEAGGLPIGLVSTAEDEGAAKRRLSDPGHGHPHPHPNTVATNIWTMDCAICCEVLDVPVVRAGADDSGVSSVTNSVAGVLARRQYMVTPCRHIFHTKCLEGWLRFRLQCPICREELPPL